MKYKNSFFKIEIKDDGTYLVIYPAYSDGKQLEIKEITEYLEDNGCFGYSVEELNKALKILNSEPVMLKLIANKIPAINEKAKVTISKDKMVAFIRFYPPSNGGNLMNKKEIIAELDRYNIKYGIAFNVIDVFLMARQYCLNIPIAKGKQPVLARDTQIEYFFNTKPLSKPKVLEDGSVDFHELNLFSSVHKGDVLAKLTPHDLGEPGTNIFGEAVQQNKPKIKVLKHGRNITLSDDKCSLISDVDGNVTFADDTVFVSDTYNVAADVDTSTGDIEYEGSVYIPGTVKTGFTVKAKGDIQVNGVVEGATLIAGGNIVIKRGVQGMNKGYLEAGGDICAQFIESANVFANGDVISGSILHSNIKSGNKVIVSGRKGFIVGGEVICETYLEVNSIGNRMETQTLIKVGVKPELYEEMKVLLPEVNEINYQIDETSTYLNVYKEKVKNGMKLTPENVKQIKEYNAKILELNNEKGDKEERLNRIREELSKSKSGSVKVMGNTYRGVTIFIANLIYIVKDKETHSWYKLIDGEVRSTSF